MRFCGWQVSGALLFALSASVEAVLVCIGRRLRNRRRPVGLFVWPASIGATRGQQ